MIEQRVTLRYGAQQIPAIVQAVQGDTGRDVIFELADYEIPAGATANYYIDKPDDTAVYNSAEVVSSTEILAHLTEQALAVPGRNNGQVRILSDDEVITSFDFVLKVVAFRGILHMQSETEVNIFDAAIQAAVDEAIEEIQEQTPVVTGMQNSIAPSYSASSTYAVGDYVMYNAQLYRCVTAITTAEAWTAAHWAQVPLANDVNDLKSALDAERYISGTNLFNKDASDNTDGAWINSAGNISSGSTTYGLSGYIPVTGGVTYTYKSRMGGTKNNWYTINKEKISDFSNESAAVNTATAPVNAYYVRLTYGIAEKNATQFNESDTLQAYEGYEKEAVSAILRGLVGFNSADAVYDINEIRSEIGSLYTYKGKLCSANDFVSGKFLDNNGVVQTSGFSAYSISPQLSVNKGDTLYIPFTVNALNAQLGGYYLNGSWVAPIGSATAVNNFYTVVLRSDINYDSVVVNIYNASQNPKDVYVNKIADIPATYYRKTSWDGKTWVALGDSWTEGAYTEICGRYTDYVSGVLGLDVINLGEGGTGVQSFAEQTEKPLTQEIAESADLITIWGSINNMAYNGAVSGNISDAPSASGSLMARWKYTIEKVLTLNSQAIIVIIGCPISFATQWRGYDAYNTNGDTIENSVKKIGELANHYGIPFVNMFQLSGFNSYNFGRTEDNNFGYDGVHPSRKGVIRVSNILIEQLKLLQPLI